jgi:hypothetical protein
MIERYGRRRARRWARHDLKETFKETFSRALRDKLAQRPKMRALALRFYDDVAANRSAVPGRRPSSQGGVGGVGR